MLPMFGPLVTVLVAMGAAGAVIAWWVANRKRIAAETIGRAQEQAARLLKDAQRDAESLKKESLFDAKEKAHELLMETERQIRLERQQTALLEQTLVRREASLAERQSINERVDRDLSAREKAIGDREKLAAAAAARYEQLVAAQQRELERVASLTADEEKSS